MKILNILTSSLDYNGIGMILLNYYKNIDSLKVKMDFLVPNIVEKDLKEKFMIKGNKVFELSYKGKKMHQEKPIMYCKKLYKILKEEKYDIIQVHGSSSMMFLQLLTAKVAGIKVRIAHCHNTRSQYYILDKLFRPIFHKCYNVAFACGEEAGKYLFGNRKFEIINNGIELDKFEFNEQIRKEIRKKYNIENKKVIGNISNFNEQKNHDFLIDVFNELVKNNNEYILILIGIGELENKIKQKVKKLGIEKKVLFIGQSSEVEKWLQAMDIMVLTSKYEGFPLTLVEWQIAGLPCIISNKITSKIKMTNLVKFLSINDSTENWANEIKKVKIENRNETKQKLKQEIKNCGYDIKENAKTLEKIYLTLLEENKK